MIFSVSSGIRLGFNAKFLYNICTNTVAHDFGRTLSAQTRSINNAKVMTNIRFIFVTAEFFYRFLPRHIAKTLEFAA
jgi:hypothetical protein